MVSADSDASKRGQRTDRDRPSPLSVTLHQLCGRTGAERGRLIPQRVDHLRHHLGHRRDDLILIGRVAAHGSDFLNALDGRQLIDHRAGDVQTGQGRARR